MDAAFEDRLRSAISAGWRVLLIEVGWLTLVWLIYRFFATAHPALMLALWGPDASWSTVATVALVAVAVFKMGLWLQAALLLWGWLWSSMLRKRRAADALSRTDRNEAEEPVARSGAVSART